MRQDYLNGHSITKSNFALYFSLYRKLIIKLIIKNLIKFVGYLYFF